jgi:NAD(P)-dependent dehydrogenase (short-subunit alcohol dehydrogenase family)
MNAIATVVDKTLEATVVGSFTRYGYLARRRCEHWGEPSSMRGETVLVTGATSGLGLAMATRLASLGAAVRFVARDRERARTVRDDIVHASLNVDVEYFIADMSELESVRELGAWVGDTTATLDVLIHNAGAITATRTLTSEGYEVTVASQILGPFILNQLLLPLLRSAGGSRVISVSSGGMYSQRFDIDRLEMGADYDGVTAYARSKRAQVVMTHEWARRVEPVNVAFHCMHPGWVDTPGVRTSLPTFNRVMGRSLRSPDQGIDTVIWLATDDSLIPASGGFWFDRHRRGEYRVPGTRAQRPLDDQRALWAWCEARVA